MKTGKVAEAVLKRSVLRQLDMSPQEIQQRSGADCAVLGSEYSDASSLYTVVNSVPGYEDTPGVLMTAAANNIAACGGKPNGALISAVLPTAYEEQQLQDDMRQLYFSARNHGMQVLGGHTQISDSVSRPQYSITGIGTRADFGTQAVLQSGQELILTKWIALAGTAALARRYEKDLTARYPVTFVDRAKEFEKLMSIELEARAVNHFGGCAMHDLSQGGIFGALWEMAERAGAGLEVDLKKIPVKQETIEICEFFNINPYYLYSAGALLIGTDSAQSLIAELEAHGIPAVVIGRVTEKKERIIRNGEDVRYLDRPQQEEWYRRFKL